VSYSYVWPPALPQSPQKGFSEASNSKVIRTPMDSGIAKQRLRFKLPNVLQLTFIMTTEQVATLETFVYDTIKCSSRFGFLHPRTGVVSEVRLVPSENSMYYIEHIAPGFYSVKLSIEVLI